MSLTLQAFSNSRKASSSTNGTPFKAAKIQPNIRRVGNKKYYVQNTVAHPYSPIGYYHSENLVIIFNVININDNISETALVKTTRRRKVAGLFLLLSIILDISYVPRCALQGSLLMIFRAPIALCRDLSTRH